VEVRSLRSDGAWRILASAPIYNDTGAMVGSLRLEGSPDVLLALLARLRSTLLGIGALIVLLGMLIGARLSKPLASAAHDLAAHAAEVRQGRYTRFAVPKIWGQRWSLQARLTLSLVGLVLMLVGILEMIVIPIQQRYVEQMYRDTLLSGIEWVGEAASTSLALEAGPSGQPLALDVQAQDIPALDPARLQEMAEQARTFQAAYTALVDMDGQIVLSDQAALLGEQTDVVTSSQVTRATWRGQEVWVASTPIWGGEVLAGDGKEAGDRQQVGMLRMAVSPARMEAFIDESRALFNLVGLIALLAGVLLAQAIGGAVAAPVQTLAAGVRKVAEGDLTTRFEVQTKDELSVLAAAYNQMVTGLQEREWLRDMFGRFVSQEVAEAIRSGQVQLEGENRVVSVLFCDIRDFTARSEQHTPAEMVALLNEYLPLVVQAAEHHGGTVNKFGGDSTLIIYGAPGVLEASAYSAVLTALEIRAGLTQLNARLAARGEAPVRIGVGINTGTVLAGAIGPHQRQEYTVIGDAVNLASHRRAQQAVPRARHPDQRVDLRGPRPARRGIRDALAGEAGHPRQAGAGGGVGGDGEGGVIRGCWRMIYYME
jgi:class 3 adenylate cyclase